MPVHIQPQPPSQLTHSMQYTIHRGYQGEPVLVQFALANQQQLDVWVSAAAISEAGFIVQEIFSENEYLKHGVTLQPGGVVLDIGANIGLFGARVLSAQPDTTYVAVEPSPSNFAVLRRNLLGDDGSGRQNSMFHINTQLAAAAGICNGSSSGRASPAYPENIRLVAAAVSCTPHDTAPLTFFPHMPGNSTLRPAEKQRLQGAITPAKYMAGQQEQQVPVVTLSQLLQQQGLAGPISLLKVDVEGEELQVLRGLDAAGWQQIQQVAAEVHDCLEDADANADDASSADAADSRPDVARHGSGADQHPQHTSSSGSTIYQQLMAQLSGPRTGVDIDGHRIKYVALAMQQAWAAKAAEAAEQDGSAVKAATTAEAAAAAAVPRLVPPPQDAGRTMAVARLLRHRGFTVTIECSFGLPSNYSVFAVRQE